MRINSNKTAFITYNSLNVNQRLLANSNRKLASGFKINVAGDDPTGYAMSGRMRKQISDLERCMTNATTGKSLCETADAALSEIDSIVQRLNELAVKAANGTLKNTDREAINAEAEQLTSELKRIADTTELNSQHVFDGTFVNKGYTDDKDVQIVSYSDKTDIGDYENVTISETSALGGKFEVTVANFPTGASAFTMSFDFPQYFDEERIEDGVSPTAVISGTYKDDSGRGMVKIADDGTQYITVNGTQGESITFKIGKGITGDGVYKTQTYTDSNGDSQTVACLDIPSFSRDLGFHLTGEGSMRIQLGSNMEQYISMSLPEMSLTALDLDDLFLSTQKGASAGIEKVKNALQYLTDVRSRVGAYQNRIEQSIDYIDASNENLTQTYSRIIDTDMAEEMVNYTNSQILVQAATSILAQANKEPQQALELLQ